jgi:hypothetical protein
MELQRSLFNQLTEAIMPVEDGATASSQIGFLRAACIGKRWLVVLDDVWDQEHENQLSCVDVASPSKLLVTTRIRYTALLLARERVLWLTLLSPLAAGC